MRLTEPKILFISFAFWFLVMSYFILPLPLPQLYAERQWCGAKCILTPCPQGTKLVDTNGGDGCWAFLGTCLGTCHRCSGSVSTTGWCNWTGVMTDKCYYNGNNYNCGAEIKFSCNWIGIPPVCACPAWNANQPNGGGTPTGNNCMISGYPCSNT